MKLHLALETNYQPMSDNLVTKLVVYFDDEPRHAVFLTLGEPYTLEKLIEGLVELANKLKELV